jgi:hypothetical protein
LNTSSSMMLIAKLQDAISRHAYMMMGVHCRLS